MVASRGGDGSNMTIGSITLAHGLMLAPMAGVSDRAFRRICRAHGAEYTVSEMVSAKALCYEQRGKRHADSPTVSGALAEVREDELPMAVQLFGREPEIMAEAARRIAEGDYRGCVSTARPTAIDINMGCPVRKVVSNGEGSALMREPRLAADIVRAVAGAVHIAVTVKIRAGWDAQSINAPELAERLEDAGASLVAVHARTREQQYTPGISLSVIEQVKRAVSIPVVGNGDIYTAKDARRMREQTGCDGVMVARGALGNPWLFEEITADLEGREYGEIPLSVRLDEAHRHMLAMLAEKGERVGLAEAKKHVAWYLHGVRGAAAARHAVMLSESFEQIGSILHSLLQESEEGN